MPVVSLGEGISSRLQEQDRYVELSQLPLGDAEVDHGPGSALVVAGLLEDGQRGGGDGGPVGEVAALFEEPGQAEGEAGCCGGSPGLVSGGDGGDQVGPFVLQPLQRLLAVGEERGRRTPASGARCELAADAMVR